MSLESTDLAVAYEMVPLQQTVTLTPMNPKGAALTVDGARKRPISEASEFESLGVKVGINTCLWIFPTVNLSGHVPAPGDIVEDEDGTEWFLQQVDAALAEAEYKATAQTKRGP